MFEAAARIHSSAYFINLLKKKSYQEEQQPTTAENKNKKLEVGHTLISIRGRQENNCISIYTIDVTRNPDHKNYI